MDIKEVNLPIPVKKTQMKTDTNRFIPDDYKKVAKSFDAEFAKLMLEQMNKTVGRSEEGSSAAGIYRSLLTGEHSKSMADKNNGGGLQKVILDQIYPERLRNEITFNAFKNQQEAKIARRNVVKMKRQEESVGIGSLKETRHE